jgi:GAF domain-containing protein
MNTRLAAVRNEPDDRGAEITPFSQLARATAAAQRLEVASRLAVSLGELHDPTEIAQTVVTELNSAFGYYLAVIHRLDPDKMLRIVAGAGRLTEGDANFLAWEQPLSRGVNGRVARTGVLALVPDTEKDPDYVGKSTPPADATLPPDPGSELSLPIQVDGRVWGVLNLEQERTHGFDRYDLMLAQAVVAQTGAALHRCQLVDQMEQSFGHTLSVVGRVLVLALERVA